VDHHFINSNTGFYADSNTADAITGFYDDHNTADAHELLYNLGDAVNLLPLCA